MCGSGTWRDLFAWSRRRAATEPARRESDSPPKHELRQRRLRRLLTRGTPHWSEEPEHCDGCGRELLLGETALLMHRGDELLLSCPLCKERLLSEGYLRVPPDAEKDAADEGSLAPAD